MAFSYPFYSRNDQWENPLPTKPKFQPSFLHSGVKYKIDLSFYLPSSQRNIQLAKFMAHMTLKDTSGNTLALSSRLINFPFQSSTTLFLHSLLGYPLRLLGLLHEVEGKEVVVTMVNNFEALRGHPLETIEMTLGSKQVSPQDIRISFQPVLSGLRYLIFISVARIFVLLMKFYFKRYFYSRFPYILYGVSTVVLFFTQLAAFLLYTLYTSL